MGRTACTEPQSSYNSTPPMGRTACTEPQCLYKGDLYFYPTLYLIYFTEISLIFKQIPEADDLVCTVFVRI